jgi:hypothetical protein
MRGAAKFVFAVVLAVMLFCTPIGACTSSMNMAGAPAHPCCPAKPAPLPDDCARPGCIYMDTHVVSSVTAPTENGGPVAELPAVSMEVRPTAVLAPVMTLTPLALRQRVVLFHQFLI